MEKRKWPIELLYRYTKGCTGYTYIHTGVLYCVYILIYINEDKGAWCLYIYIYIHINYTVYLFRALSSLPSFIFIFCPIGLVQPNFDTRSHAVHKPHQHQSETSSIRTESQDIRVNGLGITLQQMSDPVQR